MTRTPASCALVLATILALASTGCARVEGTNRNRLLITSAASENQMGADAYREVLTSEKRSTDAALTALVERVGRRVAATADPGGIHGFTWEFALLDSPSMNAFCLPGGKVAVYTGILAVCRDEAGLATVISHEIGHAIARHGGERMSQGTVVSVANSALAVGLEQAGVQPTTRNISLAAFGLGTQVGYLLPYSRDHELEADYLGLIYLAKAGYDPAEAVGFWQRFAAVTGGGGPAFLSTHPASTARAGQMADRMAEAQALYAAAPQHYGSGERIPTPGK